MRVLSLTHLALFPFTAKALKNHSNAREFSGDRKCRSEAPYNVLLRTYRLSGTILDMK